MEVVVTTGAIRCAVSTKPLPPTNQNPGFYRLDTLLIAQCTASEHGKEMRNAVVNE